VVSFNDGMPGLSMAVTMVVCAVGAVIAYGAIARPAEAEAALVSG
jgi:hypothetical protein